MATASVTLALYQSTFLAGIARAKSAVAGLGGAVTGIGARGFAVAGAAAVAFGTATAVGIKRAFDLGGQLADMSAITGRSVTSILLLRRALEDAGVSMEKIDRFIMTGQDRGKVIARALENISAGDWADAAKSIGTQAQILEKNATTFDRVSDLLGRAGGKLQGFFVGAAGSVGKALLPILERFDKMDFAAQGEKFGQGLVTGAQALAGFFDKPEAILKPFQDAFTAVVLGIGNLMVAVLGKAFRTLQAGAQALFENIMPGSDKQTSMDRAVIAMDKLLLKGAKPGSGTAFRLQEEIDRLEAKGAVGKTSILDRMGEITGTTGSLEVRDVFGVKDALSNAQKGIEDAAKSGRTLLPSPQGAAGKIVDRATLVAQDEAMRAAKKRDVDELIGRSGSFGESFKDRWSMFGPTPGAAGDNGNKKAEATLEGIAAGIDEGNEIAREAWLK